MIRFHIQKFPPDLQSSGEVDVVVAAPEAGEDGGDVERSVSHHVELFAAEESKVQSESPVLPLISLPVQHCQPLSGENPAVHVSGGELPDSGVAQDLEPPEPSHRKLLIEVTLSGKTSGVAEVNMVEVAVELTESLDDVWLVVRDVVVDPHPPGWVEVSNGVGEVEQQLSVPRSRAVTGTAIIVVPGAGCSPGSVVGVAEHLLATAQGAGEGITTGGANITPITNIEQRGRRYVRI